MINNARDKQYSYYWGKFEKNLENNDSKISINPVKSRRRNGKVFIFVGKGLTIDAIPALGNMNKKGEITCCVEALFDHSTNPAYNKEAFNHLYLDKEAIDKDIGHDLKLCWLPNGEQGTAKRAKIRCCKVFACKDESDWHKHYPWFIKTIEEFARVFTHRLEYIEDKR